MRLADRLDRLEAALRGRGRAVVPIISAVPIIFVTLTDDDDGPECLVVENDGQTFTQGHDETADAFRKRVIDATAAEFRPTGQFPTRLFMATTGPGHVGEASER